MIFTLSVFAIPDAHATTITAAGNGDWNTGATMWTGMGGYGKRGKSDVKIEGITINMPLMIEVIDELEKLESVIPQIKGLVDENGIITLHEVGVI